MNFTPVSLIHTFCISLVPGGDAQVPPPGRGSSTESLAADSGSVASLCIPCSALVVSAMSLVDTFGSLMVYDPSYAAPHVNVPRVGLPMAGNFTAEPVCVREDGCSLPLTRDHTPRNSLSVSFCVSLEEQW